MITTQDQKRRTAGRTRLAVILVPLVLALVTLSARYVSHPLIMDLLAGPSPEPLPNWGDFSDWSGHPAHTLQRRQSGAAPASAPAPASSDSGITFPSLSSAPASSATPSGTQTAGQSAPTIPTSPPQLPNPFPQPFDTTLGSNFTTDSCEQFFNNMTQSLPFRQCRPFSLLSQSSTAFLQAQRNVTALNIDIWGTCNTSVDSDQCTDNMGWFASQLPIACSEEESESNQVVVQALDGLKAYSLMRQAACLADQSTSAYCYIEAAADSDPSDLYFYSLPFGIPLPNTTTPTCSGCIKSLLTLFASQTDQIDGLKQTYVSAANLAASKCGSGYVQNASAVSSAVSWFGDRTHSWWTVGVTLFAVAVGVL
ncbi:hypothetical protein BC834DRAFT_845469 [Gloeopeniophorella convolvens]|nr:hypothetical protein BC834DRAFT_845469 [Gloeopeniophorella convolvens]